MRSAIAWGSSGGTRKADTPSSTHSLAHAVLDWIGKDPIAIASSIEVQIPSASDNEIEMRAEPCKRSISPWLTGGISSIASPVSPVDRKSTRLNSSHANISYAVFCLKKKKHIQ